MALRIVRWSAPLFVAITTQAQQPRERKISNGGLDVHYRMFGSGAPIVLLSGGPGFDCDYLEPVAQELGKSHRAILVDLRGTGRSVPPVIDHDTVSLKLTLADLEAIREQIGVQRWTVLGHSAGAVLAMAYATSYPSRIDSLLLVNSGPIRGASAAAEMDNVMLHLTPQEREEMSKSGAKDFGSLFKYLVPGYFYDRSHAASLPPTFGPANFPRSDRQSSRDRYFLGERRSAAGFEGLLQARASDRRASRSV